METKNVSHPRPVVAQPQTEEETEELVFSMTTHAMREPDYSREKEGIMAMTIAHARDDQCVIDEKKRSIHQRLAPIKARMKQLAEHEERKDEE